jgi:hypothetical protein
MRPEQDSNGLFTLKPDDDDDDDTWYNRQISRSNADRDVHNLLLPQKAMPK